MALVEVPLKRGDCRICIGIGELGDESRCPECGGSGKKRDIIRVKPTSTFYWSWRVR